MSESRYDDETLAAYAEGILPEDEAAELVEAAEVDPQLGERIELAQRMLEPPVVGPLLPPAELGDWLRAEVARAAAELGEADDDALEGPDLLEGGVQLAPVAVPSELTDWVRDAARKAATPATGDAPAQPEARVVPFPSRRAGLLRVAAAALLALCLGGAVGWIARGGDDAALTAARDEADRLRELQAQRDGELTQARQAAQTADEAAEAARDEARRLAGRVSALRDAQETALAEVEALRDDLASQGQALAAVQEDRAALERERDVAVAARDAASQERDALARRLASDDSAAALAAALQAAAEAEDLAQEAEGRRRAAETRSQALAGRVAALETRLAGEAPTFAVVRAQGVERWEDGGWRPVDAGATLAAGDVLRGQGQAALQVGRRAVRLGQALYRVRGEGLEPLPEARPPRRVGAGVLATRRADPPPQRPGVLRKAGKALLPFLR